MSVRGLTLTGVARVEGVGLFTGASVACEIGPGEAPGIWFERVDVPGRPRVAALVEHALEPGDVPSHERNTTLELAPGVTVKTVEHVLSALRGLGVVEAVVRVDGPELPLADGCSAPYVDAMERAGLDDANRALEPLVVRDLVVVGDEERDACVVIEPADERTYEYTLDYGEAAAPGLHSQSATWDGTREAYRRDIAPARTFCLLEEAEAMRRAGLMEHVSAQDVLVLGPKGPVDNELRFENEASRHKLLDLIGDLALVGRPIVGRIRADSSGHALHGAASRALLDAARDW